MKKTINAPQSNLRNHQIGHQKLRAFVTHGGLLSMFESVYHGVPLVTMPVFCDHDVNAAKAVADGYALRLELETLTSDKLSEFYRRFFFLLVFLLRIKFWSFEFSHFE